MRLFRICCIVLFVVIAMLIPDASSFETQRQELAKLKYKNPVTWHFRLNNIHRFLGGEQQSDLDPLPKGQHLGRKGLSLWYIPLIAAILSFGTFPIVSRCFYWVVQWASTNRWFSDDSDAVNLQTNVVTQVVNGPVITSVSVLFATLVSTTVSSLQSRQARIQQTLIVEVHTLRELEALLMSSSARRVLQESDLEKGLSLLKQHENVLLSRKYTSAEERKDPHTYIESSLSQLLLWCLEKPDPIAQKTNSNSNSNTLIANQHVEQLSDTIRSHVFTLTHQMLQQRTDRWMALEALHFPTVHYYLLSLLACSIGISFLVATAQADFIFHGLPVRVLWSVLLTSFTALGVVCYDLARPFGGAYHVTRAENSISNPMYI